MSGPRIFLLQQAVQIDNEETDAHFQLGRIAREQGRLQDAIDCFAVVLSQDDKHAHNEIWATTNDCLNRSKPPALQNLSSSRLPRGDGRIAVSQELSSEDKIAFFALLLGHKRS